MADGKGRWMSRRICRAFFNPGLVKGILQISTYVHRDKNFVFDPHLELKQTGPGTPASIVELGQCSWVLYGEINSENGMHVYYFITGKSRLKLLATFITPHRPAEALDHDFSKVCDILQTLVIKL